MDLVTFFIFIIGLSFGSFANVLIARLPKGKKISGRSRCPKCQKQILWYDNIPLLSFVLLKGKCRGCKKRISLSYPLVEIITAFIFVFLFLKFGSSFQTLFLMGLSPILISIFFIDLKHQIIPDELVFWGLGIVFFYLIFINPSLFYLKFLSGFLASFFLLCLYFVTKAKGMGLGDVKLAILAGSILNLKLLFNWFFLAFLTGAVAGCILILINKRFNLKSKIAFGPFLVFSLFVIIFTGL